MGGKGKRRGHRPVPLPGQVSSVVARIEVCPCLPGQVPANENGSGLHLNRPSRNQTGPEEIPGARSWGDARSVCGNGVLIGSETKGDQIKGALDPEASRVEATTTTLGAPASSRLVGEA